ncbi:MAG: hypothetical protein SGPRY_004001, partial [Prymnesium sp.]
TATISRGAMRKTVLRVRTKKVENSSERRPVGGILSSTTTPRLAAQQKKATMLSAAKHLRTVEQRSWGGATKLVSDLGDTVCPLPPLPFCPYLFTSPPPCPHPPPGDCCRGFCR